MSIVFSTQVETPCPTSSNDMSTREGRRVVADTVVRRRPEEVVAEMAEIARDDKARMAAQAARALAKPLRPGKVEWSRLRPVRLKTPVNPVPPPSPEQLRVAAVKRREHDEEEKRFLDHLEKTVGRPRTPTPPRTGEDPYGFAKWALRRY